MEDIEEIFKKVLDIYCNAHDAIREQQKIKKEAEEKLKELFELHKKNKVQYKDKKITFSSNTRKTNLKADDILEIVRKKIETNYDDKHTNEEIMESIMEEIENNREEKLVKSLRISYTE